MRILTPQSFLRSQSSLLLRPRFTAWSHGHHHLSQRPCPTQMTTKQRHLLTGSNLHQPPFSRRFERHVHNSQIRRSSGGGDKVATTNSSTSRSKSSSTSATITTATTTTKSSSSSSNNNTTTNSLKSTATKEVKESPPLAEEPPLTNPFPLLAHATENIDLSSRLRAFSNTFGIIGALWAGLSLNSLNTKPPVQDRQRRPVLVKYFGVPETWLEDLYVASWTASFLTSVIGLGLSTMVSAIVASTAPAYVKIFVRRHSDMLMALPLCQALSSGFAAVGLTVGLDEARGEPVSWIGFVGTTMGAAVVGGSTLQVLKGYKAFRASGKLKSTAASTTTTATTATVAEGAAVPPVSVPPTPVVPPVKP